MAQKGRFQDLSGQVFGRLVVLDYSHTDAHGTTYWKCRCTCGNVVTVSRSNLFGNTKSCGCLNKERTKEANTTHGGTSSRLYKVWRSMRARCYSPHHKSYPDYGGRGITVCDDWNNDFAAFREWAESTGYSDEAGLTIDRIDNSKGYYPENCRWVDATTQANNRRSNHIVTYNGVSKTIAEWADFLEVSPQTLRWRLKKRNDDLEQACALPMNYKKQKKAKKTQKPKSTLNNSHPIHNGVGTKLYQAWQRMKSSCSRQTDSSYKKVGALGIVVCQEWEKDFAAFRDWSEVHGYEAGLILVRVNPKEDFTPENCRWITRAEWGRLYSPQGVKLTYNGRTQNLSSWANELGISVPLLQDRLKKSHGDADVALDLSKNFMARKLLTYRGETKGVMEWVRTLGISKTTLLRRLQQHNGDMEAALAEPYRVHESKIGQVQRGPIEKVKGMYGGKDRHGMCGTKLYRIWNGLKDHCVHEKSKSFPKFGGVGIKLCEDWMGFEGFLAWAQSIGYTEGQTLCRKDVNGNFEPDNCFFGDRSDRYHSSRTCRYLEYNGQRHTINDWVRIFGVPKSTLQGRLKRANYDTAIAFAGLEMKGEV